MENYIKKLINLTIGLAIFIGIPCFIENWWWLTLSWLPALFTMLYLDEE